MCVCMLYVAHTVKWEVKTKDSLQAPRPASLTAHNDKTKVCLKQGGN